MLYQSVPSWPLLAHCNSHFWIIFFFWNAPLGHPMTICRERWHRWWCLELLVITFYYNYIRLCKLGFITINIYSASLWICIWLGESWKIIVAARIWQISVRCVPPPSLNNQQRQDFFTCCTVHCSTVAAGDRSSRCKRNLIILQTHSDDDGPWYNKNNF